MNKHRKANHSFKSVWLISSLLSYFKSGHLCKSYLSQKWNQVKHSNSNRNFNAQLNLHDVASRCWEIGGCRALEMPTDLFLPTATPQNKKLDLTCFWLSGPQWEVFNPHPPIWTHSQQTTPLNISIRTAPAISRHVNLTSSVLLKGQKWGTMEPTKSSKSEWRKKDFFRSLQHKCIHFGKQWKRLYSPTSAHDCLNLTTNC